MIKQTPGKIYLADQRGLAETAQFRRHSTFHFGEYQQEHKEPLSRLKVFNEELLAGSEEISLTVAEDVYVVLIPVTGALTFTNAQGNTLTVEVGEMGISSFPAQSTFQIANPYVQEVTSFLQIWIKAEEQVKTFSSQLLSFDLGTANKQLIPVVSAWQEAASGLPFSISIGRFGGRQETIYHLNYSSLFFAFVIAGAFELEGRLLHEKDGLALWDTEQVELEALSNNALVLVLDLDSESK